MRLSLHGQDLVRSQDSLDTGVIPGFPQTLGDRVW